MKLYFIGIGGIGMSALVRYFLSKGDSVAGYDLTPSPLTHALSEEGATIHYEDNPELIPEPFRTKDTLVVFTPAVPHDHRELAFFRAQGNRVMKRAELLGELTRRERGLCALVPTARRRPLPYWRTSCARATSTATPSSAVSQIITRPTASSPSTATML